MHHYPFDLKVSILIFKRCSITPFKSKVSFGQSWVETPELSVWIQTEISILDI